MWPGTTIHLSAPQGPPAPPRDPPGTPVRGAGPRPWFLWPKEAGGLAPFMQRPPTTQVRRWRTYRHSEGRGHLYRGVYKSFPVQEDDHFLMAACFVEQNALRVGLIKEDEEWPYRGSIFDLMW